MDLNLTNAALDDDDLASLGGLGEVTELRLSRNRMTDRGVATLARLPKLASLNLYGNGGVTDAGVEALGRIATLRRVYLRQTGVTAAGAAKLRAARPDLEVQLDAAGGIAAVAAGARDARKQVHKKRTPHCCGVLVYARLSGRCVNSHQRSRPPPPPPPPP